MTALERRSAKPSQRALLLGQKRRVTLKMNAKEIRARQSWARFFDLSPTVWEVNQAKRVFAETVKRYENCPDMAKETIIACAIAEVWRSGRMYQREKEAAV